MYPLQIFFIVELITNYIILKIFKLFSVQDCSVEKRPKEQDYGMSELNLKLLL